MTEEERLKAELIRAARAYMDRANCRSICVHMPDSDDVIAAGDPVELPGLLERAKDNTY